MKNLYVGTFLQWTKDVTSKYLNVSFKAKNIIKSRYHFQRRFKA